jgi:hypothetical protein
VSKEDLNTLYTLLSELRSHFKKDIEGLKSENQDETPEAIAVYEDEALRIQGDVDTLDAVLAIIGEHANAAYPPDTTAD